MSEASGVGEKALDQATKYIDAMAAELGVAAGHVYETLVTQAFAEGLAFLIPQLVLLLAAITGIVVAVKNRSGSFNYFGGLNEKGTGLLVAIIICAFIAVVVTFCLPGSVMRVVNPEYYAIREILNVFGG